MARFNANDVDNYSSGNTNGYFKIEKDMEVKRIRFMYNKVDEIEGMSVHKVKINDKDRYVNCLREYKDPIDKCPFCAEHIKLEARLIMPVYNIEEDEVQIWDRGKSMFQKVIGQCTRYSNDDIDIVNNVFEVERHGKANDKKTTYELYQVDRDDTSIEDLPEAPQILGGFVLDKSADDMEYYLENDEFPPTDDDEEDKPVRRRDSRESRRDSRESSRRDSRDSGRRTPARSSRRSNEDKF